MASVFTSVCISQGVQSRSSPANCPYEPENADRPRPPENLNGALKLKIAARDNAGKLFSETFHEILKVTGGDPHSCL
jgi:hypothetical protein